MSGTLKTVSVSRQLFGAIHLLDMVRSQLILVIDAPLGALPLSWVLGGLPLGWVLRALPLTLGLLMGTLPFTLGLLLGGLPLALLLAAYMTLFRVAPWMISTRLPGVILSLMLCKTFS